MPHTPGDAFVFVDKNWFNSTLRGLLAVPKSESPTNVHLLIGAVKDASHHHGLWMTGIRTNVLRTDGATLSMDFLVPWGVIFGFGTVDGSGQVPADYKAEHATILNAGA